MSKVVIVTGASGLLGSAIALGFGAKGWKVAAGYLGLRQRVDEVTAEINKGPGQAFAVEADIRDYDQVTKLVDAAVARWSRVDVMACVAGQSLGRLTGTAREKRLIEHTDVDWDLVVDTILKGTFHCIKAVSRPMMAQKEGHIIIMASGTGLKPRKGLSSYAAAKAGLFGLMKSAALELGEFNIQVNAVNPGYVPHKGAADETSESIEAYKKQTLMNRTSEAGEVADFFVHLGGMRNVSGQTMNLSNRIE
ncbi:MAG: SDR family NAD(P)-dependent oxidoreductase [Dehalococcoidia bacterium]|nr:SDR family NAD(P)-dependent oxidoreductase [Dehalococcoidia bacterium]